MRLRVLALKTKQRLKRRARLYRGGLLLQWERGVKQGGRFPLCLPEEGLRHGLQTPKLLRASCRRDAAEHEKGHKQHQGAILKTLQY